MSLPPSVLRIKRKHEDDPVESLYIRPDPKLKRRTTESEYVFRRLQKETKVNAPLSLTNGVRQIIATQPGDEVKGGRVRNATPASKDSSGSATLPRHFHLSKDALSGAVSGAGKRKASHSEPNVAVFVEDREQKPPTPRKPPVNGTADVSPSPLPARKRPGTAKARKVMASVENRESDPMYDAMQRYASELDAEHATNSHILAQDLTKDNDAMDTAEDEYVYETYIRHHQTEDSQQPTDPTRAGKEGPIGYLVISEADQTLWETYYDSDADSEDERDWDSEQDDENAENYYGADYPEDEVDSGDEFGDAPYRYHKGSDEEEYGSEDEYGSQDGDHAEISWIDVTKMPGSG